MILEVDRLGKTYGRGPTTTVAIGDVTFGVRAGEFCCIVGPSGCGKTTLLKCMSGLIPSSSGEVRLKGGRIDGPPKQMAVVFQEYSRSLFPWLTVKANVLFPLRNKNLSREERVGLANGSLEAVGLLPFAEHYPWQLSGGMQQRVAIARALAYQPEILLMDEPFASVDAQTRAELEDLLLQIWQQYGVTILFVTHDIDEAVYMGDTVLVLSARPSEVKETVHIDLARPRHQIETKERPDFAHLRAHVYRSVRSERRRA